MTRSRTGALGLVLLALSACSGPDSTQSRDQLEQQRADVRAGTRAVVDSLGEAIGGTLSTQSGTFQGCRSAGAESYGSFRYAVRGRLDVGDPFAPQPYLDHLDDAVTAAGFADLERGSRSGGTTLTAVDGEVELVLSQLDDHPGYLVVDVSGPCVDTPTGDSDRWSGRPADDSLAD